MADLKISALPASTTPLAGTEVLPVVQSGATKNVSVANLTSGRSIAVSGLTQTGTSVGLQAGFGYTSGLNYIGVGYNGVTYSTQIGFDVTSEFGHIQPIRGAGVYGNLKLCPNGGDVQIGAGNLVISTSGKGIDFSATSGSGTSELLNDYEEGTWTPTGNNVTYTTAVGRYTKVGRLVSVQGYVAFPATADANEAIIYGLPFTTANVSSSRGGFTTGYSNAGSGFYILAQANSTYAPLYTLSGANLTNALMSSATVFFSGQFTV